MSFKYYGQDVHFNEITSENWEAVCEHICETLINAGVLRVSSASNALGEVDYQWRIKAAEWDNLEQREEKEVDVINTQGFNPNKYQVLARRTQSEALSLEDKRRHALFGLASEVGEIMSLFQHEYQGKPADKQKVIDECGDLCWFLCELCDSYFINLSDVMEYNISKLEKRYPVSFDPERSEHRHEYGEELPKEGDSE